MERRRILNYLKIARFDHWVKQLFVLPGVWLAFAMVNPILSWELVVQLVLGMLATGAAASANYVINEWLDMEFDKYHPVKRHRPFVSSTLSVPIVLVEYLLFVIVSLIIAKTVSTAVLITEAVLLVMGILYNVRPFRTKDLPYIDVLSESMNNAIRLLIGWFCVTNVYYPPVSVVFGYWMGGAFLMATKRYAEYRYIDDKETASLYRKSFKFYTEESLLLSSFFYAMVSLFFMGIFIIKHRIEYLILIPFMAFLFCWYLRLALKEDSVAQKPEKLYKEWKMFLYIAFIIALGTVLTFVNIPPLQFFLGK